MTAPRSSPARRGGAILVAAGIFLSRIAGLVRAKVFAYYFGNSFEADAFNIAIKIPNFLQNLFGEGVLSASFIPVYANLLARDEKREAGHVAGIIASLLALVTALLVLAGILIAPWFVAVLAPGFTAQQKDFTVRLVEIIFPGTGLLVMSAWCLGILNSHRLFFLSYVAPVLWNAAQIVSMFIYGGRVERSNLAVVVAWGMVAGSALQFGIQLPTALKKVEALRLGLNLKLPEVRKVIVNFLPVVVGRGVVQISAYIDYLLATLISTGAVSSIAYAQMLYLLPVSLFGMAISAAELPEMASAVGTSEEVKNTLRTKLNNGLRQIAFFVVPSTIGFLFIGDAIVAPIYQLGKFTYNDTLFVWAVLGGSGVGLLSATLGRLYSSTFYAMHDTRTPLRYAIVHVAIAAILGYLLALKVSGWFGLSSMWATAGLTLAASLGSWAEFILLRYKLNKEIGNTGLPLAYAAKLFAAAAAGAIAARAVKFAFGLSFAVTRPIVVIATALVMLAAFGLTYFAGAWLMGIPELRSALRRFRR